MANWLITGVGGGLGRALAKAALDAGHQVAGTVRRPEALAEVDALAPGWARAVRALAQDVAGVGVRVPHGGPAGTRTHYGGRSLIVTARKIADYADTAHNAERILGEHAGHEAGDPARIAAAILKIAESPEPPVQLLLGADAVHYATQAMASFQEEFGRWAALSLSTGFSDS